jgi:hypothetical protein
MNLPAKMRIRKVFRGLAPKSLFEGCLPVIGYNSGYYQIK